MIRLSVRLGSIIMAIHQHMKSTLLAISLMLISHVSLADFNTLENFGANPGDLDVSYYLPTLEGSNNKTSALVVLLHGCAQEGETLARQTGLLALAKQHHFALLLPQQKLTNNVKRCFNWYSADDFTQEKGETLSIKNMITNLQQQLASEKVYIIGLSAGGAMASSMLVNYPEIFTAGAVVAGIPFPCADGLITGISCMRNGPSQTADELVAQVNSSKSKQTVWPRLSVWTGTNDNIVNPLNSSILAQQWVKLSALTSTPTVNDKANYTVTNWQNSAQETQVELIEMKALGHGIMVNPDVENGGEVSDYILAAPISTAQHVVKFWKLHKF